MPKVSVIMPSLNVVPYIRECMDSVIRQTLTDIEILCVDAGSTDGTLEVLEEYAQMDQRIRLIRSEKKSYGYQMNLGFREARGEYIGIVETDDYILPEMFEELYTYGIEHNADFVKSDFHIFTSVANGERLFVKYPLNVEFGRLTTSWDYINGGIGLDSFIWNGIYKREYLLENQIQFQETQGAAYQDCGFRYQVALSVKRGFFLDKSFYRYRRDNPGSSMYNRKCVIFNWSECRYILRIAQERGWTDRPQEEFLAQQIAQLAYTPYKNMLAWCQPAEGTSKALDEFRTMVKNFIKKGLLNAFSVPENTWLSIRMFIENPEIFDNCAKLSTNIQMESIRMFLKNASQKGKIVIFGCGRVGTAVCCLLRNSGLENVTSFCDNDRQKWGTEYLGCPVKSPEAAVKEFGEAYFIIANRLHQADIKKQLFALGVPENRMMVYNLSIDPMLCTSIALRQFS